MTEETQTAGPPAGWHTGGEVDAGMGEHGGAGRRASLVSYNRKCMRWEMHDRREAGHRMRK
ncbi:hypothetical protein B0H10DRAFT_2048274 [Mycena sp. CBHHK59/15]|nr:hypothetical protein B0H10DRAFT_2048274 [Mycena sp. CBHHK59/15]